MRMPGMDGAQLLEITQARYPDTIRIILSGYADKGSVFRTVGPAHIYLAKPCDAQTVHDTIVRPLALRRHMQGNALRAVVGGMSHLPSVPDIFSQLQAELASPKVSAASLAKIISHDLAMTAALLKMTNSSYFTVGAHLTTPLEVINLLGVEMVQSLVLQIGIFRHVQGKPELLEPIKALSDHAQHLGALAEAMAQEAGAGPEQANACRCAAMLSPIGSLVLLDSRADDYAAALATVGDGLPLQSAERAAFGVSHNFIGAYLLSLWGFSDMVVEAVCFAREPSLCTNPANKILCVVHAATALSPPFPLLPEGVNPKVLDINYLVDARCDKHLGRWQNVAQDLAAQMTKV
jgi:HD-like signal output (HDOD) protein